MKKLTRGQTRELSDEIDLAGQLQAKRHRAELEYEAQRKKVIELLQKHEAKEEEVVKARHYQAQLCHDDERFIDPNTFILRVRDRMIRSVCLRVLVTHAEVVLGYTNPALLRQLTILRKKQNETLHISPRREF
jgi:hypothetical protein